MLILYQLFSSHGFNQLLKYLINKMISSQLLPQKNCVTGRDMDNLTIPMFIRNFESVYKICGNVPQNTLHGNCKHQCYASITSLHKALLSVSDADNLHIAVYIKLVWLRKCLKH